MEKAYGFVNHFAGSVANPISYKRRIVRINKICISPKQEALSQKIEAGLKLAFERMVEFKKYKKSTIVVERDGKMVELDPFTMQVVKVIK